MVADYCFVNVTRGEINTIWVFAKYMSSITNLNNYSPEEIDECFEKVIEANEWSRRDVIHAYPDDGSEPIKYKGSKEDV